MFMIKWLHVSVLSNLLSIQQEGQDDSTMLQ